MNHYSLARLARAGFLYSVGDTTGGGVAGPTFVLFNTGLAGLDLTVFSVIGSDNSTSAAYLRLTRGDPGLALGHAPVNARFGAQAPSAILETDSSAIPAIDGSIGEFETSGGGPKEWLAPGVIIVPPNVGLVAYYSGVGDIASIRFVWAEIPPSWFDGD